VSRIGRLTLRARLALALVGVALLAVGLAALLGNLGLEPRLNEAAHARLQRSATHAADLAAAVYQDAGGWRPSARSELAHLAALDELRIEVRLPGGRLLPVGPAPGGATAEAQILAGRRRVGTIVVAAAGGTLLTPEEQHLRHSLDRLHLAAAGAAAFAALLIALLLAETLSRPLRRIRAAAERLERGDLDARVDPGGAPELQSTGRALNRLAETLEHAEELRKASVADLAHELRTPANGLLQRIEAAQDDVLPLPENLAAMHDEAIRLTRLLDDLARLADAEQPGLLLDKQPVDLAQVAQAAADSFAPQFTAAGIAFTSDGEPTWVSGDAGRLEQIVANLLSNALRYTEAGGTVQLTSRPQAGEARLEVADSGIGIAPDDLRHIYTRFWRGDRSRSRATGGTGIGLAIVHELVRAHDGRIDVDSTPGQGTRFRITLPAGRPKPTRTNSNAGPHSVETQGRR
jgi:two-component system, OmpR family, sensor histidine kinase BaeS